MTDAITCLTLDGVTAGYPGGIAALTGVDLSVNRGEVVAVLGANGAGKTTLLRTIAGVLRPQDGQVAVLGHDKPHRHLHGLVRSGLAYVPDDRALFPELTVGEHLRLVRGLDRDLVLDAFPALAALMGRRASLLSGGEQQMLALSRALGTRPQLLLVDEMSLGLAPLVVDQILEVTAHLVRDVGCTAILVEQHVDRVLRVVDRAVVLARGKIALDRPATALLADRDLVADAYLGVGDTTAPASHHSDRVGASTSAST